MNSIGSFHCQCGHGHVLDYNGRTCSGTIKETIISYKQQTSVKIKFNSQIMIETQKSTCIDNKFLLIIKERMIIVFFTEWRM